ncbi:exported hypothetical protein [Verrucomicrobia bacterium]|nr:exported hypothetical protein [Verrucomicrobiota bacterium]
MNGLATARLRALAPLLLLLLVPACTSLRPSATKQQSLNEWRSLTAATAPAPQVFLKGDTIRFYFHTATNAIEFSANWRRFRIPSKGFKVHSATLHLDRRLPRMPEGERGWRQATVIAGEEWRRLATNLIAVLTPSLPGHGIYYQALLADGVLFRDAQGVPRQVALGEQPKDVVLDHRCSLDETVQRVGRVAEASLAQTHPTNSLFLIMAPDVSRFTQPLLVEFKQRRCLWLSPNALYDPAESRLDLSATAQGLSALFLEAHGLALLKNPVSSACRLGDLAVQSFVRFVRIPPWKPSTQFPPLAQTNGMDLEHWEQWLDHFTGTRQEQGSLQLLIDGERFFPRLTQAIAQATNHIYFDVYIFDKDDVAIGIADQLKQRSSQIDVRVLFDRLGSIAAGAVPPATPLPENFVTPASIYSYLTTDSRVRARAFLNPWLSADHSKVYLVDGSRAWLGGMNLGREYRYEWHDLMVELQGPVVTSLEDEFRREWAYAGWLGDLGYLRELARGPHPIPPFSGSDDWVPVRLLPTKTAWKPFGTAVLGSLRHAKDYIYLENPYLFDKRTIIALAQARNRGVDVRVILPRINDFEAAARSNVVIANYLLQHGVRVFFYPGMTHVKALLVDGWACLGSGNLNHLSLRVCQEHNVATSSPAFAARLKQDLFEDDFQRSYELKEPIPSDLVDFLADLVLEGF